MVVGMLAFQSCETERTAQPLSAPTVATGDVGCLQERAMRETAIELISGGNLNVDEFGVVLSDSATSTVPTRANKFQKATATKVGIAKINVASLTPSTRYYYRAYATNYLDTVYGEIKSVVTPAITRAPIVETPTVDSITTSTAKIMVNIPDNGGLPVTTRGICWARTPDPKLTANTAKDVVAGSGLYSLKANTMLPNTLYYVRGYAINCKGTSYGPETTFTTAP